MSLSRAAKLLLDHANHPDKKAKALKLVEQSTTDEREVKFALSYMDVFGYLARQLDGWKDVTLGDIVEAVKRFQRFFGLKQTGRLSAATVRAMAQPRCGFPDVLHNGRKDHQKYLAIRAWAKASLPAWRKRNLLVRIAAYVPGIGKAEQQEIIAGAFAAWTRHGNIDAQIVQSGQADIVISTGEGRRSNFDGPGGTLAWAYLPTGNDQQLAMKFDLGETWVTDPRSRGVLLFNVACHEIGHLFGLDHSRVQSALMAPYYNPQVAVPQADDDIPRFQARYGARPAGRPPVGPAERRKVVLEFNRDNALVTVDGKAV